MSDPQGFHEKLLRLRPNDTLKPDTVFVAILLHDYLPTDDLVQANALWIKCPKSKRLDALIKVYKKQHSEETCLRHDFKELDTSVFLGDLTTRSKDFIALEAVKLSDLNRRNSLLTTQRKPLQDLTNRNYINSTPASYAKGRSHPDRISGLNKNTDAATKPPQPSTNSITPSPAYSIKLPEKTDLKIMTREEIDGWTDFAYERREHQERSGIQFHLFNSDDARHLNKFTENEWNDLTSGQQSYFVERAKKVASLFDLPDDAPVAARFHHRAFWCFYYDIYHDRKQRLKVDSHADFPTTVVFTDEMISAWRQLDDVSRENYVARVYRNLFAWPIPRVPEQKCEQKPEQDPENTFGQNPGAVNLSAQPEREHVPPPAGHECRDPSIQPSVKGEISEQECPPEASQPASQPEEDEQAVRLNLAELFSGRTPEQLENSVDRGVEMLQQIRQTLEAQPSQDARQWLQTIENVQKQAARTKTVVGVVGATGAGKSSVINAMLDEERLVPTNCMRACTAVVTEISYNHEEVRYRAEIEFIARQDWAKELKVLFQDLLDGSGEISREATNEDSDAGIAYAKIRAVYPNLTKEDMKNATIDQLLKHSNVKCLGTERALEHDDSMIFYKKLQHYVDSKEKSTSKDKADKDKGPREMEFWPLIRVVRLYVKAPALATGAVIVDLPGVHDSNQARAAVASNYMKACTGLWIVAPITRAVDDKSAKTLLGDSFKRQLKMDGGYSAVTFICSKTDDISLTEALDSLGLEDEARPLYDKKDSIDSSKKRLQKKMSDLKETKGDILAAMESADEELEIWEKLQEQQSEGQTVYKPKAKSESKKRKRNEKTSPPRKKSKYTEPDSDDDFIDDESDSKSDAGSDYADLDSNEDKGEPLTEDDIAMKIAELRTTKKEGRGQRMEVEDQLKGVRKDFEVLKKEQEAIDAQLSAKCISGRNEYSRSAIQKDFAAGIKELDQELAEEEDAANFNPEVDARDYDKVAGSLPVFCVSARAYQKLMGRLQKDKAVPGFESVDETEVPKLQAHCRKLTEAGREAACKRFLTNLIQLLNSLRLWSSNDGSGRNLTDAQLKREGKLLNDKLDRLDTALEKSVKSVIDALAEEIQDNIYDIFPTAINSAKSQANDIARKWGAPVNRGDRPQGGLYWATYKAVVRRDGCFANGNGSHNFNEDLTEPIIRHVAGPWEKIFSRRLAPVLSGLSTAGSSLLTAFHADVETRAVKNGASIAAFQMLKQQLPVYKETLKDASSTAKDEIMTKQRDINREFVPTILDTMMPVYNDCVLECGSGQFNRMKGRMERHVEQVKDSMYTESSEQVKDLLTALLKEAKKTLLEKTDEVFMAVKRDYTGVVVGQENADQTQLLPREQRAMRKAVLEIVDGAELTFKRAVGLEPKEEKEEEAGAGTEEELKGKQQEEAEASESKEDAMNDVEPNKTANQADFAPLPLIEPQQGSEHEDGPIEATNSTESAGWKDAAENVPAEALRSTSAPAGQDLLKAFVRPQTVTGSSLDLDRETVPATKTQNPSVSHSPCALTEDVAVDAPVSADQAMEDAAPSTGAAYTPLENSKSYACDEKQHLDDDDHDGSSESEDEAYDTCPSDTDDSSEVDSHDPEEKAPRPMPNEEEPFMSSSGEEDEDDYDE